MVLHIQVQVFAQKETQHELQSIIKKKTKNKTLILHIGGDMMDRLEEDIFVLYQRLYHLPLVTNVV